MDQQQIEVMAAELGLNPETLSSLVGFLMKNLKSSPELQAWCLRKPDEFLSEGVKAWHRMHTEFLTELLEGVTARAKEMLEQMAAQVWLQIREQAGLSVH